LSVVEEIKRRILDRIALLEEMKRSAASSGMDSLNYHMMIEGLKMALRIVEEVEEEARSS